jgi:hypothetical protein
MGVNRIGVVAVAVVAAGAAMTFVLVASYGWIGALGSVWFVVEFAFLVGFARGRGFGGRSDYLDPESGDSW